MPGCCRWGQAGHAWLATPSMQLRSVKGSQLAPGFLRSTASRALSGPKSWPTVQAACRWRCRAAQGGRCNASCRATATHLQPGMLHQCARRQAAVPAVSSLASGCLVHRCRRCRWRHCCWPQCCCWHIRHLLHLHCGLVWLQARRADVLWGLGAGLGATSGPPELPPALIGHPSLQGLANGHRRVIRAQSSSSARNPGRDRLHEQGGRRGALQPCVLTRRNLPRH